MLGGGGVGVLTVVFACDACMCGPFIFLRQSDNVSKIVLKKYIFEFLSFKAIIFFSTLDLYKKR